MLPADEANRSQGPSVGYVRTPLINGLAYGGDYNPEQWPESVWQEDVRLMQQAGVNLVSVGIFAWSRLEPSPGDYDFAWLDRLMDLLHANGIWADLATATASPPPWLASLHPTSLPITRDGIKLRPGSRQHYCPNSVAYREAAAALVQQLANRYGSHPALGLWHIGNEYGCHVSACYCEASARAFRSWLERRYGTIAALNEAWGTAFWSQHYRQWEEIYPPRVAPTFLNPTQQLDWWRFSSDTLLECFEVERSILKQVTPHIPVTTNFMNFFKPLDYWKWAEREDIVSLDSYPDPADPAAHIDAALGYDLARSLGNGKPWFLMEQAPSQVNWRSHNVVKPPGLMRLWSHQTVARGSAGVMFFQWRASRFGSEKYHSAMVPHSGTRSRTWHEVVQLGHELQQLDVLLSARVQADVAIVWDWESWWALELDAKPSSELHFVEQVRRYYRPLFERNITVDFVAAGASVEDYRLVVVPNLYLVRDDAAEALLTFVSQGGTLLLSFFSGIVDENDHVRLGGYPAPFCEMLGLRIDEVAPFAPTQTNTLAATDGSQFQCSVWAELIDLQGATALARYQEGWYTGRPAITRHEFGRGVAYYVGTQPDATGMVWLLDMVAQDAVVSPASEVPEGVEAVWQESESASLLYLLNHRTSSVEIVLEAPAQELLTGRHLTSTFKLDGQSVAILSRERAAN